MKVWFLLCFVLTIPLLVSWAILLHFAMCCDWVLDVLVFLGYGRLEMAPYSCWGKLTLDLPVLHKCLWLSNIKKFVQWKPPKVSADRETCCWELRTEHSWCMFAYIFCAGVKDSIGHGEDGLTRKLGDFTKNLLFFYGDVLSKCCMTWFLQGAFPVWKCWIWSKPYMSKEIWV